MKASAHSVDEEEVLSQQQVDPSVGLSQDEAAARLNQFGPNRLKEHRQPSAIAIFVSQFKSLVVILLLAASGVAFIFGRVLEGVAIAIALLVNAAVGFTMEYQAVRSMAALRKLGGVSVKVRRNGSEDRMDAEQLVPGDIVLLEAGDRVTSDLRLIQVEGLECDESALTGESLPVKKSTEVLAADTSLADRINMAYKGTAVTSGSGIGLVVATGMDTELGRISSLVEEAVDELTPLEKRLEALGRRLIVLTLVVAVVVAVTGIVAGNSLIKMLETAIALAVAAVPEGLPVVATIALAKGMRRMAARNAVVKQLVAVESLGAATAILTDKTGTLTENRMTLARVVLADSEVRYNARTGIYADTQGSKGDIPLLGEALEIGALCSNAALENQHLTGDPMEVALLAAAGKRGLNRNVLLKRFPERREVAFSSDTNMMATVHKDGERFRYAVKGAPEAVIAVCDSQALPDGKQPLGDEQRARWLGRNQQLAAQGLRVLALAEKYDSSEEANAYKGLTLVGLAGLLDPPREGVSEAIAECRDAGIRVVMITGDHPATAAYIGAELGITGPDDPPPMEGRDLIRDSLDDAWRKRVLRSPIFARVTPEQKLDIVTIHQKAGDVVAMTGDGINDAPALKKADVGVAMGQRGTEVAREAADVVLRDDAFTTIVAAVEHGRTIFDNIRKFIVYLLSGNLGEIIAVSVAAAVGAPIPLLPLQILYINFVNDVLPALALGTSGSDPSVMQRPPRHKGEPLVTGDGWMAIIAYGFIIAVAALCALGTASLWLGMPTEAAVTVSFLTFGFARLWHVVNMRTPADRLLHNPIIENRLVWLAIVVGVGLLAAAVYLPWLNTALGTAGPGVHGWLVVLTFSWLPVLVIQPMKAARILWEGRWNS